jgi:hypothetical protein
MTAAPRPKIRLVFCRFCRHFTSIFGILGVVWFVVFRVFAWVNNSNNYIHIKIIWYIVISPLFMLELYTYVYVHIYMCMCMHVCVITK